MLPINLNEVPVKHSKRQKLKVMINVNESFFYVETESREDAYCQYFSTLPVLGQQNGACWSRPCQVLSTIDFLGSGSVAESN